jgi:hypothetical protein
VDGRGQHLRLDVDRGHHGRDLDQGEHVVPPQSRKQQHYRVTFDRIGRHRSPDAMVLAAADGAALAEQVKARITAQGMIRSGDFEVHADLDAGTGHITVGGRDAGNLTIKHTDKPVTEPEQPEDQ